MSLEVARCPICGMDVPLESAPMGGRKTGIVCPNCGTPFSYTDPTVRLEPTKITLLLDHYEITGTIYVSPEFIRFSDAWESLIAGERNFLPITDCEIRRHDTERMTRAEFMEVQKSEIRGAVPSTEPPAPH